jgi:hypothetical protein
VTELCAHDMSVLPLGTVCPECGHARALHPSVEGDYVSACLACTLHTLAQQTLAARDDVMTAMGELRIALTAFYRFNGVGGLD